MELHIKAKTLFCKNVKWIDLLAKEKWKIMYVNLIIGNKLKYVNLIIRVSYYKIFALKINKKWFPVFLNNRLNVPILLGGC